MAIEHRYLTVSYRKDLAQVVALRSSLRACGDETPHHVIVHTEDVPLFEQALAGDPGVILGRTADVLPPRYERYRFDSVNGKRAPKLVRSLMKRIGMRDRVAAASMTGWHYQQLTKIHATASMPVECIVILDSDLIALRKPDAGRMIVDDRCVLLENQGANSASHYYKDWLAGTRKFLRVDDKALGDVNYVFGPVVWSQSVVRTMIESLEREHRKPMAQIFADARLQSEYFLYGLFARSHPDVLALLSPSSDTLSVEVATEVDEANLPALVDSLRDTDRHPFLWVHGFVPDRDALVSRLREALAN